MLFNIDERCGDEIMDDAAFLEKLMSFSTTEASLGYSEVHSKL